jgi:hypothetical protein
MTSSEFFWLTQRQDVPTNMSGMVVPMDAWVETLKILQKAGSGARFEHLLCIARCISHVCFSKSVRVLIVSRNKSEADNLNAMQHRVSSFYYTYTFFKNERIIGFSMHILFTLIFLKKLIGIIFQYINSKWSITKQT